MATNTQIIGLRKPTYQDMVDVDTDISQNMQKLEDWLKVNVIQRSKEYFSDFVETGLLPQPTNVLVVSANNTAYVIPASITDASVTSDIDTSDFREGGVSARLTANVSRIGLIGTKQITPVDLSTASHLQIWVKSSISLVAGDIKLVLDNNDVMSAPLAEVNIPDVQPLVWTRVKVPINYNANLNNISYIGLKKTCNYAIDIHVDEIKAVNMRSNVTAGTAYITGYRVEVPTDTLHEYQPNVDTYVDLKSDGTFSFTQISSGSLAPTLAVDSIRLGKVVTDDDIINSVQDLRQISPIGTFSIADNSILTQHIADRNVTTNKIGIGAVRTTNLATDSVTEDKIAPDSVTASEIKNGVIPLGNGVSGTKAGKIDAEFAVFTTDAVTGTETSLVHSLGRIPVGFIVVNTDKAGSIFRTATAWDNTRIYLASDVAVANVTIIIF